MARLVDIHHGLVSVLQINLFLKILSNLLLSYFHPGLFSYLFSFCLFVFFPIQVKLFSSLVTLKIMLCRLYIVFESYV